MACSQPIFFEIKRKKERLTTLSITPDAKLRAIAFATSRTKSPATLINAGPSRRQTATKAPYAMSPSPAYVLKRVNSAPKNTDELT